MSEYNIQMNKYNALNVEYDQLYPATKIKNVDGLDTALQNNDPRNWGIGTNAVIPSGRSANNITADGLYYCDVDTPTVSDWLVYHAQRDDNWAVQLAVCSNAVDYGLVIRKKMSGVWKPWEWDNPPMMLGGMDADGNPINEYRTTERYMGHPVYVKLINFGSLPNADTRTAKALIAGTDVLVSIYGMATGSDGNKNIFPIMSDSGIVARFWFRANSGEIAVRTTDDRSGFTAIFWVKYYKTTD